MKKYNKWTISEFRDCDQKECTICTAIEEYFKYSNSKSIDNLAASNLERHIRAGKHWKLITHWNRKKGDN
jgi:hypothetical protein